MAIGEVLVGGGVAMVGTALGGYTSWVRRRNDASRDAVLAAYTGWMMAWSDFISLGASQLVAAGEVHPVTTQTLQPLLSQLSRTLRVCLVTCDQRPVAVIGQMHIAGVNDIAPLLINGAPRGTWEEVVAKTTKLEGQLVDEIRRT